MESQARHDVRHPLATISMIASTVSEFGTAIDSDTLDEYRLRIGSELESLASQLKLHDVDMDIGELEKAAQAFVADMEDVTAASSVAEVCGVLLEELKAR